MPELTPILQRDFVDAVHDLAGQIARADWRPSFLIGIGRGGLVPAVFLSHATGRPTLSVDYSSQVPDFAAEPLLKLARRTQQGERLLFVDDINDSGRTIVHLRAVLAAAGAVQPNIRFATLIDNIRSSARVEYAARVIDRAVTK